MSFRASPRRRADATTVHRLFIIPVNESAFEAGHRDERRTPSYRTPLIQLALAAIHAHTPPHGRSIVVVGSQLSAETNGFLQQANERGYISDLVLSTARIEHGVAMDIGTHHGIAGSCDVFYCQDADLEILSPALVAGLDALITSHETQFVYDYLTEVMNYGVQVVPRRPMCALFAGSCSARLGFPVSLEHLQGEILGADPSPLRLDRMWHACARELRRHGDGWLPDGRRREFHTDTGWAFVRLAPKWGLKASPVPEALRAHYVHRRQLGFRWGLSDTTGGGRTVAEHLSEVTTRLREVYDEEPVMPAGSR